MSSCIHPSTPMAFYHTDLQQGEITHRISCENAGIEQHYESGYSTDSMVVPGSDVSFRYSFKNLERLDFGATMGSESGFQANIGYSIFTRHHSLLPTKVFLFGGSRHVGAGFGGGIELRKNRKIFMNIFYSQGIQSINASEIYEDGTKVEPIDSPLAEITRSVTRLELPIAVEIPVKKLRLVVGTSVYHYLSRGNEDYRVFYQDYQDRELDTVSIRDRGVPWRVWIDLRFPLPWNKGTPDRKH